MKAKTIIPTSEHYYKKKMTGEKGGRPTAWVARQETLKGRVNRVRAGRAAKKS